MKNSGFNLRAVSLLVSLLWYLNIVIVVVGLPFLIMYFFKDDVFRINIPIVNRKLSVSSGVSIDKASATVELPLTGSVISYICLVAFLIEAQWAAILFNLRRIFKAIKYGQPFHAAVVKSLHIIAAIVSFWYILVLFHDIILSELIFKYKPAFAQQFNIEKQASFKWLIAGAVIYILADIFRYGGYLKKETEEFV